MVKLILFIPLFLMYQVCTAQFNDTTNYVVNYTSSGSVNKTNDGQSYLLNNAVKFGVRKKAVSLNFNNNWIYGKQNRQLTNNDFSSSLDFNLYKTFPHFFYWGLVSFNTSKSLKINSQLLTGAGIAYNILDREDAYLNISDGILFDSSDLMLNDEIRDVYQTYRNSLRLAFKFVIHKVIVLNSADFFQSSLSNGNNYIFKSDSALSLKMNKWLSLTTAFSYNRISRTRRDNSLLSYGLTFERYF